MKSFSLKISLMCLVAGFLTFACDPDTVDPPVTETPASVRLGSANGALTSDATLDAGATFKVVIDATPNDNLLRSITINEDGSRLASDRFTIVDPALPSNNPFLLVSPNNNGGAFEIDIIAQDGSSTRTYEFVVTDEGGLTSSTSLNITTISGPLTASLTESAPFFWGTVDLEEPSTFRVELTAQRGGADITTLYITENGLPIEPLSRVKFAGADIAANPIAIDDADKAGFTREVSIRTQDSGLSEFKFLLTDTNGDTASTSLIVNVGTPVDTIVGVLLNQGGGTGTGGLDLDTGTGTGSRDAAAEIKDEGIDTDKVLAENWIQRISGANGSEIRIVGTGVGENFSFNGVTTKEQIAAAFDASDPLTETAADGEFITPVVNIGDLFTVKNGENYYLLLVTDVVITTDNNDDFYEFSIKK